MFTGKHSQDASIGQETWYAEMKMDTSGYRDEVTTFSRLQGTVSAQQKLNLHFVAQSAVAEAAVIGRSDPIWEKLLRPS